MKSTIRTRRELIPGKTTELILDAPQIAAKAKPGNFVILRAADNGERIPLTIADCDPDKGTITLVYLVVGKSTALLDSLREGDALRDLCGPLGKATHIEPGGTVVCVGGGTGVAAMHHIAKGHHQAGNHVISVVGARSRDMLLFCDELDSFCPELLVATDDGTRGHKGFVTDLLLQKLQTIPDVREVVAVGPVPMMAAATKVASPFDVRITVSLNSIMVDGVGMCGACRVTVGGETRFACVDGPEFDGREVDFIELSRRLAAYRAQETISLERYQDVVKEAAHG